MGEDQHNPGTKSQAAAQHALSDDNATLLARLKKLVATPGISDKDRKQIERNIARIIEAEERTKG